MALVLILLPIAMGLLAWALPSNRGRPWLLPLTGAAHLAITLAVLGRLMASPDLRLGAAVSGGGWLVLDPVGGLVLLSISGLFFLCAWYTVGYLRYRQERPNGVFCACMLAFLGTTSLVAWAHHLGLMWVAIEASALVAAPLIYFNHTPRSIEATWKYLLVGSIGIALALLGSFFLAYSCLRAGLAPSLMYEDLLRDAPKLSQPWLHAAFVLLLVGYGTKMGLAPMHTWEPDAYGEAPGVVGALFAGGMVNVAFLAILRIYHVCQAAGQSAYTAHLLIFMGLLSMLVAGIFMVGQRDFKRLLAYSSVEHMGILALGLGIGGPAIFATLLHMINNAATKGVLFLSAGNIHRAYGGKTTDQVQGALRRLPLSGALFLAGFLAITGSPPFGPFISEFLIANSAFAGGRYVAGALFLAFLLIVFIGMGATVLAVVQGRPSHTEPVSTPPYRDGWWTGLPPLLLMGLVLMLGLYIPNPLQHLLHAAAHYLEVPKP